MFFNEVTRKTCINGKVNINIPFGIIRDADIKFNSESEKYKYAKIKSENLLFQMKYKEILKKYTHFLSTLFQKINFLF